MNLTSSRQHTKSILLFIAKIFAGSVLMAISAQITIPLPFVPITGQTIGMAIVALTLGAKAGTASMVLYLAEGAMGLPVFSNGGSSILWLMGSSGGYLFGYVASTFVIGTLSDKGLLKSVASTFAALTLGGLIIYAFGLAQLSLFVPADKLLAVGFLPFIIGDILKNLSISLIVSSLKNK